MAKPSPIGVDPEEVAEAACSGIRAAQTIEANQTFISDIAAQLQSVESG